MSTMRMSLCFGLFTDVVMLSESELSGHGANTEMTKKQNRRHGRSMTDLRSGACPNSPRLRVKAKSTKISFSAKTYPEPEGARRKQTFSGRYEG